MELKRTNYSHLFIIASIIQFMTQTRFNWYYDANNNKITVYVK